MILMESMSRAYGFTPEYIEKMPLKYKFGYAAVGSG